MAKTSFYSGSGITNTEQNAIDGALSGAQDARDEAVAAKDAAAASAASAASHAASLSTDAASAAASASAAAASASAASSSSLSAQSYESLAATSAASAAADAVSANIAAARAEAVNVITDAQIGTVTEVIPNTGNVSATVTNGVLTLDFNLPRGYTGPQGPQGVAGSDGAQGPQGPQGPQGLPGISDYSNADVDAHLNTSTASTNDVLTWNGTDYNWTVPSGLSDIVNDTTPQLGGDLHTNGNNIVLADFDRLYAGTGNDLEIYHNSNNNSFIKATNANGELHIDSAGEINIWANGYKRIYTIGDGLRLLDGAGANGLEVSSTKVRSYKNLTVDGNITVSGLVDSRDIQANIPASLGTSGQVLTVDSAGTGTEWTTVSGVGITDLVQDTTPQLGGDLDTNGNNIVVADDDRLYVGSGNDLEIYHQSANGHTILRETNSNGSLYIEAADIFLRRMDPNNVASYTVFSSGGSSTSLHDPSGNAKLYVTTSSVQTQGNHVVYGNISVTGTVDGRDIQANIPASLGTAGQVLTVNSTATGTEWTTVSGGGGSSVGGATGVDFNDSVKARFGTGYDLEIYHDGSNSYISDVGTGDLILKGSNYVKIQDANGTTHFQAYANNGATLYYGGTSRLNTNGSGVYVNGNLGISGTVDGRDIAANIPSSLGTSGQVLAVDSAGTATEWTDTKLDGYSVSVVSALPASPDANTIYFVT